MKSFKCLLVISSLFFASLCFAQDRQPMSSATANPVKVDPGLTAALPGAAEGLFLSFNPSDHEELNNKGYGTDTTPMEALDMIMPSTFGFYMSRALITNKWDAKNKLESHLVEFFTVEDKLNFLSNFDRRTLNTKEQIFDVLALAIKRGNQTTSNSLTVSFNYKNLTERQQLLLENHLLPGIEIFNSSQQASLVAKRDLSDQERSYIIELKFLDKNTVLQFGDFVAHQLRKGNPRGVEAQALLYELAQAAPSR